MDNAKVVVVVRVLLCGERRRRGWLAASEGSC